jgi:hypothetical protein
MRFLAVVGVALSIAAVVLFALGVSRWFYRRTMRALWRERDRRKQAELTIEAIERELVRAPVGSSVEIDDALRHIYDHQNYIATNNQKRELA